MKNFPIPSYLTFPCMLGVAVTCVLVTGCTNGAAAQVVNTRPVSDLGYRELIGRSRANRQRFFVYEDQDSGFNHGFPSGFFGATSKIAIDPGCVDAPASSSGCATNQLRLDRNRGNVFRISFAPLAAGQFAGVNFEEPRDWGVKRNGIGYNLTGAIAIVFDVRTPNAAGTAVQFGVGGCLTDFVPVAFAWEEKRIPFSSLGCGSSPLDLSNVQILFSVAANNLTVPAGATVLLDNIRFEPVPVRQRNLHSFPLSTQTFGIRPSLVEVTGRVPIPPDQILRNLTTTYESAILLQSLIARGQTSDLSLARRLADAFIYALGHENQGLPLPSQPGVGLHNAYESGDLPLLNDQSEGVAKAGQIRLAGFSASTSLCGHTGFCLVLDGATGGNNAFAMLGLLDAYKRFTDPRYLNAARTIGAWIFGQLADTSSGGFGGYFLGFNDGGHPDKIVAKSIENNADIFVAFSRLAAIEENNGFPARAQTWTARANRAGDFVVQLFNPASGCFFAGTVPIGTKPSLGVMPNGPQKGSEVINTFDFLDSNSFTTLALASSNRYHNLIDWRRPAQCVLNRFARTVRANGVSYQGFNIVSGSSAGPNGIAWEFTGQVVTLLRFVDRLYSESRYLQISNKFFNEIAKAQLQAPFGNGQGLVASTLANSETVPAKEQCLSTPFQCIPARVGLAATVWAIFAERNINPLAL